MAPQRKKKEGAYKEKYSFFFIQKELIHFSEAEGLSDVFLEIESASQSGHSLRA